MAGNQGNIYEEVTNRLIEQMEQGLIPWRKPWVGGSAMAISYATGKPYSLLNQMLMQPGEYITFNQCQKQGGKVRKGSKSSRVYLWKTITVNATDADGNEILDEDGNPKKKDIWILKGWNVFNLNDCEGIEPRWTSEAPAATAKPEEAAEKVLLDYVQREGIALHRKNPSAQAYYSPAMDLINLPCLSQYTEAAEYYSTAFHEATHSTGHPSRLNRFESTGKNAAFGSDEYSKEELTAEIGAACILHQLGIETPGSFKNSAAYLQGWLKKLKDDKRFIISASARAEKAVRLILNQ